MRIDIKGIIIPNDCKEVYDWYGIESVCPRDVTDVLRAHPTECADVYINSNGGEIFAGAEIYEELREHRGGVSIHVVGLAASAASVIACAGDSDITPVGMVMVHNVSGGVHGDWRAMEHGSEMLQQANRTIAAAYVAKSGMSEAEALEMMEHETWLTAADAVEKGLINRISAGAQVAPLAASVSGLLPQAVVDKARAIMAVQAEQRQTEETENKKRLLRAELEFLRLRGEK